MIKCSEVSQLAASGDIATAGPLRRLEFRLHLMMCRQCRNYVRQVGLIGAVARRLWPDEDPDANAELEAKILEKVRPAEDGGSDGDTPPPDSRSSS